MVSGTPEAEGTTEVTYTATDGAGATVTLTFSITVNPMLDFGDLSGLFGAFSGAAGKANPASEHDEGAIQIIVGQPYSLTIPEIPGGTPPKTYSVVGLPAGLTFDRGHADGFGYAYGDWFGRSCPHGCGRRWCYRFGADPRVGH